MIGGECTACSRKKQWGLQTKLKVNEPGDINEQEADRIADQVMATQVDPAVSGALPRIQRFTGQPTGQMDAAPASVDQTLSSPGRPLEPALRQDMEQRFGHDFSRVRVHTGAGAEQSVRDVNARAYTVGRDVVFGRSQFTPGTHEWRRLLAHELTHVMQQSGASGFPTVQREVDPQMREPPRDPPSLFTLFVADPRKSTDKAFARKQGQVDAARIQINGRLDTEERQLLNAKLAFFRGDAKEIYVELIRPVLRANEEIEMPAENFAIQSYVFADDKGLKTSEDFARRKAREMGERIRRTGRPSRDDRLEIQGMLNFFTGEAKEVYAQEVNETAEKRDPRISRTVQDAVDELDRESPRERVLTSNVLSAANYDPKRGLRQWALELKAIPHRGQGNYLLAFFAELGGRHVFEEPSEGGPAPGVGRRMADVFIKKLAKQGVMVMDLATLQSLHEMEIYEKDKQFQVDINPYHIYDWKRTLGQVAKPFVEVIEVVIHFVPVVGQAVGALEALYGRTLLTGEKLTGWERLLGVLPYAGKLLRAGRTGVTTIFRIARESGISTRAAFRLLRNLDALAEDEKRLREIKRIVDTGEQLSAEHQNLLRSAIRRLKPLEEEAQAAGVAPKAEKTLAQSEEAKPTAPVAPAAPAIKAPAPGTVLAEEPVSGNHAVKATPEGIKLCSPLPCKLVRDVYKKELTPKQVERLQHAENNRLVNPRAAVDEAAEVREELEAERLMFPDEQVPRDRRTVTQYQRDLARRGLMDDSRLGRIVKRVFARKIERVLPPTTSVELVAVEGSEAGIAQGRAAVRPGTIVNPEVEARIDLPNVVRKKAGLHVPGRGESRIPGSFKPDDIEFLAGDTYRFKDHKEVSTIWKDSFYSSEAARPKIRALLFRDLDIARALQPNCKGFAFTTNSKELAELIASEIGKLPKEARELLHAP